MDELEGGRGYWAPDISYHNGRFYVTATYRMNDTDGPRRRQIVVSSDRPEGPYSEPFILMKMVLIRHCFMMMTDAPICC